MASKNWILDALAKEIGSRSDLKWAIFYSSKGKDKNEFIKIPKTKAVMFMHQSLLDRFLEIFKIDTKVTKVMCWYTHPNPKHEFKNIINSYI